MEIREIIAPKETISKKSIIDFDIQENNRLSFLWKSIALTFTLWYGGQTFSLRKEELVNDLALNYNKQLKTVIDRLLDRSIFIEDKSGLIFFNPRFKTNVDASALLLVSQGVNIDSQLSPKKGFETLQGGFIQFARSNHHPVNNLYDSIRSFVSDYCQRAFGSVFTKLAESGDIPDYSLLRRLIIRLSLYPSLDFVLSGEKNVELLLSRLIDLKTAIIVADEYQQKFVLLRSEIIEQ